MTAICEECGLPISECNVKAIERLESRWRLPSDRPDTLPKDGRRVRMIVDFGAGECETCGRAYSTDDDSVMFADEGGWCTQYVKRWRFI